MPESERRQALADFYASDGPAFLPWRWDCPLACAVGRLGCVVRRLHSLPV